MLRDTALTARTRPQYYNCPALSTRTFATDLASVSQYVGAVSGAAATAVFIILVFLRGGVGSCTTLTAGLAAVRPDLPLVSLAASPCTLADTCPSQLFAVTDVVCYAIWSFKGQMGTVWCVPLSPLSSDRLERTLTRVVLAARARRP